jgi:hypothetical protein
MFRIFQTVISTPANTMYSAASAMKTGMGVVINPTTMTAGFPAAMAGSGISIVDKERIPTGRDAGRTDLSDYSDEFNTHAEGDMLKLHNGLAALTVFGTDQFVATNLQPGDRIAVNPQGMWARATAGVQSIYIFDKFYDDAGNQLAQIRVADNAAANA